MESEGWTASMVVSRSLGRRVAVEAVVRQFQLRACLKGEVVGYGLEPGYILFRFKEAEKRDAILHRPWVVAKQVLAMEPWRPGFFPVEGAIRMALVWVCLPRLPVELWREATIQSILSLAGDLSSVDKCTVERRWLGFAKANIRIDLSWLLRPGVLAKGSEGMFWQMFVYEKLEGVCFRSGRFHPSEVACPARGGNGCLSPGLCSENMVQDGGKEDGVAEGGPSLGPWLVVVRQWLPTVLGKKTVEST